jgi:hypothetical protein
MISLLEEEVTALLGSVETSHLLGDLDVLGTSNGLNGKGEDGRGKVLLGSLNLGIGGVVDLTLLGLAGSSGEEDELALVGGESGNVEGHVLLVLVLSSMVNTDSDGSSESGGKLGGANLSESETSADSLLASVLAGHSVDDGSQLTERSRRDFSGLGSSGLLSKCLVCHLVKVAADSALPVLSQMSTVDHVVVLGHGAY